MNWVTGCLWLAGLFVFFFAVGTAACRSDRGGPFRILTGYLIYSFGVAVAGITVQLLNLSWSLFRFLMWGWMAGLLAVSLYCIVHRNDNWKPAKESIRGFVKNYWALFLIIGVTVFLCIINYPAFWLGNRSDGGFYLSRMASYPYTPQPFEHDLSTGLYTGHTFDQYTINTHELEASVFLQFLNMPVGLFARVFLSAEGYILFACCIYTLAEDILRFVRKDGKFRSIIQFVPGILLLFTTNFVFMANNGILDLQDSWQTSTAMYFGSSIVRTCGFFLLLLPYIRNYCLNWKVVLQVMAVSLVLISKSTIALPLIIVCCIAYIYVWMMNQESVPKIFCLIVPIAMAGLGIFLQRTVHFSNPEFNSIQDLQNTSMQWLASLSHSIVPWVMAPGLVSGFLLKNRRVLRLLLLELCLFILLFVPGFSAYFTVFSFYTFVTGRVITAFAYFFICTMISLTVTWLASVRLRKGILTAAGMACCMILAGINFYAFTAYGGDAGIIQGQAGKPITLAKALEVLKKNPDFMPVSTINLADALNRLAETDDHLAVLTETYYESDGVADLKHILTRPLAPTVIFPTANTRFPTDKDPVYGSYTVDQQQIFESFLVNNDEASTAAFGQLLDEYQIDAVLLRDHRTYDVNMNRLGFTVYESIYNDEGEPEYYLYTRNQV